MFEKYHIPRGLLFLFSVLSIIACVSWYKVYKLGAAGDNFAARLEDIARKLETNIEQTHSNAADLAAIRVHINALFANDKTIERAILNQKPHEVRLIESYGIVVDDDLKIEIRNGVVVTFPLTDEKASKLKSAGFVLSVHKITAPKYVEGYDLPPVLGSKDLQQATNGPKDKQRAPRKRD